jgi:hypothetical protein
MSLGRERGRGREREERCGNGEKELMFAGADLAFEAVVRSLLLELTLTVSLSLLVIDETLTQSSLS